MEIQTPKTEKQINELKGDIMLDLYHYQKDLEKASRKEDIDFFKDKITEAEELYLSLGK